MKEHGDGEPVTSAKREYGRFGAHGGRRSGRASWGHVERRLRATLAGTYTRWTVGLQERFSRLLARLPSGTTTDPRLDPRQRQRLIVLTLVLSASLLSLLGLSLRLGGSWPDVPALIPPLFVTLNTPRPTATPNPNATPGDKATAVPTRSVFWWLGGTPELGEEDGTPHTPAPPKPDFYTYYFPLVARGNLNVGRLPATQVPEPAAVEPAPNWPDGLSRLTNSKLGLHTVRNNHAYIMEYIRRARPRVVKAVDDLGWLADVKRVSPNTLTIGRLNSDQNEDNVQVMDPAQAADQYVAAQLERYRLNPGVDVWEGWNEFVPVTNERMAWYARFEARRACRMQELGFRAAVGGFSVGVPEYEMMAYFMPALEAAYECDGVLTLHEYNSPTMDCGVTSGRAGIIPGAPNLGSLLVGYHTLRYRFWYEGYLKPAGMGTLPLVITEAGVEGRPQPGGPCNDPGGRAWKNYAEYWVQRGYGSNGPEAYVNVLSWYDTQLRQDSYVIGATLFTAGAHEGDDRWFPFDLREALVALAHYAVNAP